MDLTKELSSETMKKIGKLLQEGNAQRRGAKYSDFSVSGVLKSVC